VERIERAEVVVFDVNETLSDMAPVMRRLAELGVPEATGRLWFPTLLRDGFALTAAGASERFSILARGVLHSVLADAAGELDLDQAVEEVMEVFLTLPVHPDVPEGVRALAAGGARLVTLSNGSAEVAERLLGGAGIRDCFERLLSVEEAGVWKPAREAYAYAVRVCGSEPARMLMVASHPWDIDGAARAGLRTCWLNRGDAQYPVYFHPPDQTVGSLPQLAGMMPPLK